MKPNESAPDRSARIIIGFTLIIVSLTILDATDGNTFGIIAAAAGAILVATGIIGFCPAYKICGLSTCKVDPTRVDATTTDA